MSAKHNSGNHHHGHYAAVEPLLRHSSHFQARGACKSRPQASFKENTIDFARVLRAMKRLWVNKGLDGLLKRRDAEADLVESCIA